MQLWVNAITITFALPRGLLDVAQTTRREAQRASSYDKKAMAGKVKGLKKGQKTLDKQSIAVRGSLPTYLAT